MVIVHLCITPLLINDCFVIRFVPKRTMLLVSVCQCLSPTLRVGIPTS